MEMRIAQSASLPHRERTGWEQEASFQIQTVEGSKLGSNPAPLFSLSPFLPRAVYSSTHTLLKQVIQTGLTSSHAHTHVHKQAKLTRRKTLVGPMDR